MNKNYLNFSFAKCFMPNKYGTAIIMQCACQNFTCTRTSFIYLNVPKLYGELQQQIKEQELSQ